MDLNFYWDPVCPFAWMTSKWVREVARQRPTSVDWRFISLRLVNKNVDYDSHFPTGYERGHTNGLRLLRVAARARADFGRDAIAGLYESMGKSMFEIDEPADPRAHLRWVSSPEHIEGVLAEAGLPTGLGDAADDEAWDAELNAETEEALGLTGKDVGTPIIHYDPPHGPALFGPVISRLPLDQDALRLWDHVIGLASFGGFTELKRSLRELPRLPSLGAGPDDPPVVEDWHGGSRRQKK